MLSMGMCASNLHGIMKHILVMFCFKVANRQTFIFLMSGSISISFRDVTNSINSLNTHSHTHTNTHTHTHTHTNTLQHEERSSRVKKYICMERWEWAEVGRGRGGGALVNSK